jgi:uncharacterized protein
VIVIDTGPVVASANRKDDYHVQCVKLLQGFPGPLLLPAPLITEIGYMLYSRAGSGAEAGFATLDRRHFSVVRPSHAAAFTLLP